MKRGRHGGGTGSSSSGRSGLDLEAAVVARQSESCVRLFTIACLTSVTRACANVEPDDRLEDDITVDINSTPMDCAGEMSECMGEYVYL